MANSRPLTAQEQLQWKLFVAHKRILSKQIEIANRTKEQCITCQQFADDNQVSIPSIAPVASILQKTQLNFIKLGRIISGVEEETIGLSFPSGPKADFEIVADPTMTSDEIAQYQLSGIVLLIAGATILAGAIAYALWERGQTKKVIARHEAVKSVAESKFCADPNSDICARWMSFRESQGYDDEQTFVDDLYDQVVHLQETLPTSISSGVSWAIPVIAGIGLIVLLGRN